MTYWTCCIDVAAAPDAGLREYREADYGGMLRFVTEVKCVSSHPRARLRKELLKQGVAPKV